MSAREIECHFKTCWRLHRPLRPSTPLRKSYRQTWFKFTALLEPERYCFMEWRPLFEGRKQLTLKDWREKKCVVTFRVTYLFHIYYMRMYICVSERESWKIYKGIQVRNEFNECNFNQIYLLIYLTMTTKDSFLYLISSVDFVIFLPFSLICKMLYFLLI